MIFVKRNGIQECFEFEAAFDMFSQRVFNYKNNAMFIRNDLIALIENDVNHISMRWKRRRI
jgi:hypothetical protein